jgi:hypothetical protein
LGVFYAYREIEIPWNEIMIGFFLALEKLHTFIHFFSCQQIELRARPVQKQNGHFQCKKKPSQSYHKYNFVFNNANTCTKEIGKQRECSVRRGIKT